MAEKINIDDWKRQARGTYKIDRNFLLYIVGYVNGKRMPLGTSSTTLLTALSSLIEVSFDDLEKKELEEVCRATTSIYTQMLCSLIETAKNRALNKKRNDG